MNQLDCNLSHTDGPSMVGGIATMTFAFLSFLSFNDLDHVLRLIAVIVTICVGITTLWYNIARIRHAKKKKKEEEEG